MAKKRVLKKINIYTSYLQRIIIRIIISIAFLLLSVLLLLSSINNDRHYTLKYDKRSTIDYKVYLKDNTFYEEKYLEKDMTYIASLIDFIDIDYNYKFKLNEASNFKYDYQIIATLLIHPENNNTKILYSKDYVLKENTTIKEENKNEYEIKESINLDYNYYNNQANTFKTTYGINCTSELIIHLKITTTGKDIRYNVKFNTPDDIKLTLPLSEKQIDIKINSDNFKESGQVEKKINYFINDRLNFAISIVLCFVSILNTLHVIKMLKKLKPKKDNYSKYISRLLTDYDRTIVESKKLPDFDDFEVLKITTFDDLLDVRDNLKLPIIYVPIHKEKCCFYIKHEKTVYIYYVKAVDLEENNENKQK